jgi:cell division control protein 6
MCDKLREKAADADVPLNITGPINCRNYSTAYALATALVNEFREPENKLPNSGYSTDKVFEFLYEEIENVGGNVLIILDEIDNIPTDARNDFLYELPRAKANSDTPIENAKIGLIGISNDLKFVDVLEPKVKSTLGEREIKFGPYDANELGDILEYYADIAFKDGVLEGDVIPLAAAFSAQERGDVRQGKRILQKAGELARLDDADVVTAEHTREATETVETSEILDYFEEDLTTHQALTYLATTLAVLEPDHDATTKRIYKLYASVAESRVNNVKSERKIYEFLDQLSMQGLVTSAEENLGREGGRRYVYDITDDPKDIISAVRESSYSGALPQNTAEILSYHIEEESTDFEPPIDATENQQELWDFT